MTYSTVVRNSRMAPSIGELASETERERERVRRTKPVAAPDWWKGSRDGLPSFLFLVLVGLGCF